jgi:hypothetical protein
VLNARVEAARNALEAARSAVTDAELVARRAWSDREAAAARVRAVLAAARPAAVPSMPAPVAQGPAKPAETSAKLMQNALFLLGGLLLAVAAIVFTAVAWSQFGVGGRAVVLASVTVLALAAPLVALRRGLRSTAETFAAVGLVLVLLDGYAAWYVDLFGISNFDSWGYAGAVFAVTAAVAVGYEQLTGLVGPRYAALALMQPVLPLLVASFSPDLSGWALTYVAVALANLAVVHLRPTRVNALGVVTYILGGLAVLAAAACALLSLLVSDGLRDVLFAASSLVAAAAVVLLAGLLARSTAFREVGAGLVVVALGIGGVSVALQTAGFAATPVAALVVTLLAVVARLLPASVRRGPRFAAAACVIVLSLMAAGVTVWAVAIDSADWRLPAVLAILTVGGWVSLPRPDVLVAGGALLALSAAPGFDLPWWSAAPLNLTAAAAALVLAGTPKRPAPSEPGGRDTWALPVAALLVAHACFVASQRPGTLAATLAGVALLGLLTAWRRYWFAPVTLGIALLAVPAALWQAAAEFVPPADRWAAPAAAVGLVLAASLRQRVVSSILGVSVLVAAAPSLHSVVLLPFEHAGRRVSGPVTWYDAVSLVLATVAMLLLRDRAHRPGGRTGAGNTGTESATAQLAGKPVGSRTGMWLAAIAGALALPMLVAAAGLPWPATTGMTLIGALAVLVAAALRDGGIPALAATVVGAVLAAAGLCGAAATQATMIVAVSLAAVAGMIAGTGGVRQWVRLAGWSVAAAGALAEAYLAGDAAGLAPEVTAFLVAGAAAGILALGVFYNKVFQLLIVMTREGEGDTTIRTATPEGRVLEIAGHVGAVAALALTLGAPRHAAAVCTVWGIVLGVRAIVASPGRRALYALAATAVVMVGAWILLYAEEVAVVEAYTILLAAVAVQAGWTARARMRTRSLSSWIAYGPALAAGLLPTLVTILTGGDDPWRRLGLGVAALAVTVFGAQRRLQAPVVAGGLTLIVLALQEVARFWDLLPRWIPLAVGGLLLIGLAMTLERRRRDVARLRTALGRMG